MLYRPTQLLAIRKVYKQHGSQEWRKHSNRLRRSPGNTVQTYIDDICTVRSQYHRPCPRLLGKSPKPRRRGGCPEDQRQLEGHTLEVHQGLTVRYCCTTALKLCWCPLSSLRACLWLSRGDAEAGLAADGKLALNKRPNVDSNTYCIRALVLALISRKC